MVPESPIPFPTRRTDGSPAEASAFAAALREDLFLSEEEPSYELLERATNGELSEEESEALALRAEWDEELARELAELAALRERLVARGKVAAPRRASHVWRTAGLAAALLLAAIGVDRAVQRHVADSYAGISATPTAPQPLFSDGFESGTSSTWTN